jgi:putative PIN family toxin of toxin-antitoxin system
MIRVVIDTNVFISALIRPESIPAQIIQAWRNKKLTLLISPAITSEIKRVLQYPHIKDMASLTDERIAALLNLLETKALHTPGRLQLSVIQDDPDDNMILSCAVEGKAGYIISGDNHLLRIKEYDGIHILTPRQFLDVLENDKIQP